MRAISAHAGKMMGGCPSVSNNIRPRLNAIASNIASIGMISLAR